VPVHPPPEFKIITGNSGCQCLGRTLTACFFFTPNPGGPLPLEKRLLRKAAHVRPRGLREIHLGPRHLETGPAENGLSPAGPFPFCGISQVMTMRNTAFFSPDLRLVFPDRLKLGPSRGCVACEKPCGAAPEAVSSPPRSLQKFEQARPVGCFFFLVVDHRTAPIFLKAAFANFFFPSPVNAPPIRFCSKIATDGFEDAPVARALSFHAAVINGKRGIRIEIRKRPKRYLDPRRMARNFTRPR